MRAAAKRRTTDECGQAELDGDEEEGHARGGRKDNAIRREAREEHESYEHERREHGMASGGKWMAKAFSHSHGQFREKAHKAGMSTGAYAAKVSKSPSATTHEKRQANLAKLGAKYGKH